MAILARARADVDDNEIIQCIQAGDSEAFALLVRKYQRPLLTFVRRLVRDDRIVEDLGQDVFLRVYRSLDRFDPARGTPFSAWLFTAARNRCISELRRRRETIPIEENDLPSRTRSPEQALLDAEQEHALTAALEQLPEPYRTTLVESLRGRPLDKLALDLKISTGTAKSRLFRAREKLRVLLFGMDGGNGHERI